MTIDRRVLLGTLAAAVAPVASGARAAAPARTPPPPEAVKPNIAAKPETIALWPGDPPGTPPVPALPEPRLQKGTIAGKPEIRLRGVGAPSLFLYRPAKPNGISLLSMPGGGYSYLSVEFEGADVARYYTKLGYTVFVLNYRLPGEGWTNRVDAPIQDAIRAIRLIRHRAASLHLDPAKIGVIGFSAGGHLASNLATFKGEAPYREVDAADRVPHRPDFLGLAYAVTTLRKPATQTASYRNLLGPNPSPELIDRCSPILHVDKSTPPCFLIHALDDKVVSPDCSIEWLSACRADQVPIEAYFLDHGGHGFALKLPPENPGSRWPDLFHLWIHRYAA